jgi:hypothetical protein
VGTGSDDVDAPISDRPGWVPRISKGNGLVNSNNGQASLLGRSILVKGKAFAGASDKRKGHHDEIHHRMVS